MTPTEYLRLVVDRDRLALLGRAALGPFSVTDFGETTGGDRKKLLLAALRRYLVDEEILARADRVYWRIGGRYPGQTRPT